MDRETLSTIDTDSPTLSAYDSGRARCIQGRPLPAGATEELARGYYDEMHGETDDDGAARGL